MRLRTALIATTTVLIVLALGSAATLIAVGRFGRDGAAYIVLSVRSVEVAQQIRLDLAKLRAGGPDAKAAEKAIESNLVVVNELVQSPGEQLIVERLREAVRALRGAMAQPTRGPALLDSAVRADRDAEALVAINVAQAHEAEAKVARQSRTAVYCAEGAAAVLLIGIVGVIVWTRARILEPLRILRNRIQAVALGGPDPKTPLAAPIEVREVVETFDAMFSAISSRRQDRLELLGRVASAVSAPLDKLMRVCDGLSPGAPLPPDGQLRSAFGTVGRELVRLRRILAEYVQAAQVEEGVFEVRDEIVDLGGIVVECVEMFRDLVPATRFQLNGPSPALVQGDGRLLAQVVNNLLAIAARHASAAGEVRLLLRTAGTERRLDIDVASSAEGSFERLYNALHGLDQRILGVPGTGFTIQTSRRVIEAMRGTLLVVPSGNEGVSLSIRLRAAATQSIAASG